MTNIFLSSASRGSDVAMFADAFYRLLMTRQPVCYTDIIYLTDSTIPKGHYKKYAISSEPFYSPLKKAVSRVVKELNQRCPGSVIDNGKTKGKSYKYVGENDDPLGEDRKHCRQQTVKDYVRFCKGTIGLLPSGWFASFFEETNFLLEAKREAEAGNTVIGGAHDRELRNLRLLPVLYNAITDKAVISFEYKPYDGELFSVVLHPQYLKEYNGRWFILGQLADDSHDVKSYPIDRIASDVTRVEDVNYLQAPAGYYREYFENIIGVRHTKRREAFDIVIRTHSAYYHGLVITKPFHHSQIEVSEFGHHEDGEYGEVMIHVEPTVELVGKLLSLGADIEVVSPIGVRRQVAETIAALSARYASGK